MLYRNAEGGKENKAGFKDTGSNFFDFRDRKGKKKKRKLWFGSQDGLARRTKGGSFADGGKELGGEKQD